MVELERKSGWSSVDVDIWSLKSGCGWRKKGMRERGMMRWDEVVSSSSWGGILRDPHLFFFSSKHGIRKEGEKQWWERVFLDVLEREGKKRRKLFRSSGRCLNLQPTNDSQEEKRFIHPHSIPREKDAAKSWFRSNKLDSSAGWMDGGWGVEEKRVETGGGREDFWQGSVTGYWRAGQLFSRPLLPFTLSLSQLLTLSSQLKGWNEFIVLEHVLSFLTLLPYKPTFRCPVWQHLTIGQSVKVDLTPHPWLDVKS